MIAGAVAISMASPKESELVNWKLAMNRECDRYKLNHAAVATVVGGDDPHSNDPHPRRWWEIVVMCLAVSVFVWLAIGTRSQSIPMNMTWMFVLIVGTIIPLGVCGTMLWRRTRFS